ncbi:adenylate kinase [Afipia clevelandensis]|uniref:Adenylate kinase n=1 Tax=Afipia clevelandensis ATCC 49720 TaxID=883079 RepID=K8NTZ9_9BRAD|nr:adenylate kinase [Afipia clevelandensis]EKS31964.1 adenylate kinase [Afipia clevelandensis ATCC 49720]
MRIVLLGPPGAGKGTQAESIVRKYGVLHLSTGDMLRAAAQADTEVGRKIKQTMASGALVSDQLVIAAVVERISQDDARKGFILDGFPRTVSQAVTFDDMLQTEHLELDHVVELQVDEKILLDRILIRANEAKERGIAQREDDNHDSLKVRLDAYRAQTAPVIDYYRARGILKSVDGLQPIEHVTADVFKAIDTAESPKVAMRK